MNSRVNPFAVPSSLRNIKCHAPLDEGCEYNNRMNAFPHGDMRIPAGFPGLKIKMPWIP
jgi:hypothetical protein